MTRKLSEIIPAPSAPVAGDTIVGVVASGPTDVRFSVPQIFSGASAQGVTRTLLSSATAFYVRSDGNDANNGLSDTVSGAWATIQHALNVIGAQYDLNGQTATLNIGAGSFVGAFVPSISGGGTLVIQGAGAGSTTVTANMDFGDSFTLGEFSSTLIYIKGLTMQPDATHHGVLCNTNGHNIIIGDPASPVNFNLVPNTIAILVAQARVITGGPITINSLTVGGIFSECLSMKGQAIWSDFATWTIVGNPAFTSAFVTVTDDSHYDGASGGGFAGAATGKRYSGTQNSNFDIPGAPPSLTWFPGDAAGTVDASSTYGGQSFATQKAGAPGVADLIDGAWWVFRDTVAGTVVLAYNDGGVIRTAAIV